MQRQRGELEAQRLATFAYLVFQQWRTGRLLATKAQQWDAMAAQRVAVRAQLEAAANSLEARAEAAAAASRCAVASFSCVSFFSSRRHVLAGLVVTLVPCGTPGFPCPARCIFCC